MQYGNLAVLNDRNAADHTQRILRVTRATRVTLESTSTSLNISHDWP